MNAIVQFVEADRQEPESRSLACPPFPLKRVLVVDDDSHVRKSLAAVLESEGFDTLEADNGHSAIAQAVCYEPDLLILDLKMPKMDGWTTFQRLNDLFPLVPAIVITAKPDQYEHAVRLGVDAFMEKPLNFSALIDAARKLVGDPGRRHIRKVRDPEFITEFLPSEDAQ